MSRKIWHKLRYELTPHFNQPCDDDYYEMMISEDGNHANNDGKVVQLSR